MTEITNQTLMLVEGMRQFIEAFEADRLSIERLSWELMSRIAGLAAVADPEWAEELLSMRNQIEVVNAFYIESGRSALSDDERKEVNDVLGELKAALVPYDGDGL